VEGGKGRGAIRECLKPSNAVGPKKISCTQLFSGASLQDTFSELLRWSVELCFTAPLWRLLSVASAVERILNKKRRQNYLIFLIITALSFPLIPLVTLPGRLGSIVITNG
jgi:hypothetical protein